MPRRTNVSLPPTVLTVPRRPTTALSLRSVTVVAGLLRSTWPSLMACATAAGIASASTFRPTFNAKVGLTELCTTSCIRALSVQNFSLPNVSCRNTRCPSVSVCDERSSVAGPAPVGLDPASSRAFFGPQAGIATRAPRRTTPRRACQQGCCLRTSTGNAIVLIALSSSRFRNFWIEGWYLAPTHGSESPPVFAGPEANRRDYQAESVLRSEENTSD